PAAGRSFGSGRLAMNPGHGAPNVSAPAACIPASSRPNRAAAAASADPAGTQEMTSMDSSQPTTPGTGTAPALASQPSPRASAPSAPDGPPAAVLTNTTRPPARVARQWRGSRWGRGGARAQSPPPADVGAST